MTNVEFNSLSLNERARIILQTSHYLSTIDYYNYSLNLYSLSGFFIEVKVAAITSEVHEIKIIKDKDIDKFIPYIDLSLD